MPWAYEQPELEQVNVVSTKDYFVGADNEDLEDHSPNVSPDSYSWFRHGNGFDIQGNKAAAKASTVAEPFNRVVRSVHSTDYHITTTFRITAASDDMRFAFRISDDNDPRYYFVYITSNSTFTLFYFNGTSNDTIKAATVTTAANTDYTLHIIVEGLYCYAYIEGFDDAGVGGEIPNNPDSTRVGLVCKDGTGEVSSFEVTPLKPIGHDKRLTNHDLLGVHTIATLTDAEPSFPIDIDADGVVDLVVAEYSGDLVWFKRGTSYLEWTKYTIATGNTSVEGLACGDFDGDGEVEVVVLDQTDNAILLYKPDVFGDPTGTWSEYSLQLSRNFLQSAIVADVDDDGLPEIIYAWEGNANAVGGINVLDFDAAVDSDVTDSANWSDYALIQHDGAWNVKGPFELATGEWNILFSARSNNNPAPEEGIYYITRPASPYVSIPWSETTIESNAKDWLHVDAGDFFGNGNIDVIGHEITDGNVYIYDSASSWARTAFTDPAGSNTIWNVVALDLGDERPAVMQIIQDQGYYLIEWDGAAWVTNKLEWFPNISHPGDNMVSVIHEGPDRQGIVLADADGDRLLLFDLRKRSDGSTDVTLAGENYLSLLGQQITAHAINLGGSNVTGTLPESRGGSHWNQTANVVHPNTATEDVAIGGTTSAGTFFFDVSLQTLTVNGDDPIITINGNGGVGNATIFNTIAGVQQFTVTNNDQNGTIVIDSTVDLYLDGPGDSQILLTTDKVGIRETAPDCFLEVGGAGHFHRETNAFGTTSVYPVMMLGDRGETYSLVVGARASASNAPFAVMATWDAGTDRDISIGGGAYDVPDANTIRFFTAPTYTETTNTGVQRLGITPNGTISVGQTVNSPNANIEIRPLTTTTVGLRVRQHTGTTPTVPYIECAYSDGNDWLEIGAASDNLPTILLKDWNGAAACEFRIRSDGPNDKAMIGTETADDVVLRVNATDQTVWDGNHMVIPIKSTTGDPTGTNGAIYYNNADAVFRVYENGAWRNM